MRNFQKFPDNYLGFLFYLDEWLFFSLWEESQPDRDRWRIFYPEIEERICCDEHDICASAGRAGSPRSGNQRNCQERRIPSHELKVISILLYRCTLSDCWGNSRVTPAPENAILHLASSSPRERLSILVQHFSARCQHRFPCRGRLLSKMADQFMGSGAIKQDFIYI